VSTRESLSSYFQPPDGRCSFCGETNWSAVWMGHDLVLVCRECARDVLPCLIADAFPYSQPADGDRVLTEVAARFWRALLCAKPMIGAEGKRRREAEQRLYDKWAAAAKRETDG
jgi:hypothetical protein